MRPLRWVVPAMWLTINSVSLAATHEAPMFWHSEAIRSASETSESDTSHAMLTARASVISRDRHEAIHLTLANQGTEPIPLSFVIDEYTADTFLKHHVVLEKLDFFDYPSLISPGAEVSVDLMLPKDVAATDVVQLTATLQNGRAIVTLKPTKAWVDVVESGPAGKKVWFPQSTPAAGGSRGVGIPSVENGSVTSEAVAAAAVPIISVPVVVEFVQEWGSVLKVEVRWDDTPNVTIFTSGDQQTFQLVPGRHTLHVASRLSFISETTGEVHVQVSHETSNRIHMSAHPRMHGVDLRVEVWHDRDLVTRDQFGPHASE